MAAEAYAVAAEVLRESGEIARAVTVCRTALALQPSNRRLLSLLQTLILQPTDGQRESSVLPA